MSATHIRESRADRFISITLLGFCAFVGAQTAQLKIPASAAKAGPNFIPWAMVILISLCAILLLFRSLKQTQSALIELPSAHIWIKMLAFVALMIAYAIALMPVGYIWSTIVIFTIGLLILGERNPLILIIFPAAMTCAVYFGFTKLLSVWLP